MSSIAWCGPHVALPSTLMGVASATATEDCCGCCSCCCIKLLQQVAECKALAEAMPATIESA